LDEQGKTVVKKRPNSHPPEIRRRDYGSLKKGYGLEKKSYDSEKKDDGSEKKDDGSLKKGYYFFKKHPTLYLVNL
jgi:hypothetical protein